MSKPQFSKRRKGQKVPTYPLAAKSQVGSSKITSYTTPGRPRNPRPEEDTEP